MGMYQQLSQDLPMKTGSLLDCDSCSPDVGPTSASPFPWGCMVWGKGWADWNDGKYQGSGSFYSNCHGDISVICGTVTSQMLTIYILIQGKSKCSLGDHLHKTKYERTATTQPVSGIHHRSCVGSSNQGLHQIWQTNILSRELFWSMFPNSWQKPSP